MKITPERSIIDFPLAIVPFFKLMRNRQLGSLVFFGIENEKSCDSISRHFIR